MNNTIITVKEVVQGLTTQGYKQIGGSDVFRILSKPNGHVIKVFYDDYDNPNYVIVIDSIKPKGDND